MKRFFFSILFIFSIIICITGCEEVIDIEFINNTDFTLVCDFEIREPSDTLLHDYSPWPNGIEKTDCVIKPHSTDVARFEKSLFSGLEKKGLCHSFYFFDADTIKTVSWERIKSENIVVKKVYIYSLNDILYKYNHTICVP